MNREGELWLIIYPSPWARNSTNEDEYYLITSSEDLNNGRTLHTFVRLSTTDMKKKSTSNSVEYNCLPWENRKDRKRVG